MSLKTIIEKRRDGHYLIKLEGKLDTSTAAECEKDLFGLFGPHVKSVVFNLAGLNYISSVGLRLMIRVRKSVEEHHGKLALTHLQAPVAKVFELSNILPRTYIFESVESADIFLDAIQRREAIKDLDIAD